MVADEVRVLADNSKHSSDAIGGIITNIENLLGQVQSANEQNLQFVKEEIGQISGAREEAEKLGTLQESSKKMAGEVSASGDQTGECGYKLRDMTEQMKQLVESSRQQAERIVAETKSQTEVALQVEDAFKQVESVAERLIETSSFACS